MYITTFKNVLYQKQIVNIHQLAKGRQGSI